MGIKFDSLIDMGGIEDINDFTPLGIFLLGSLDFADPKQMGTGIRLR